MTTWRSEPAPAPAWRCSERALAALAGRDYVLPDDVKRAAGPVLEHRLIIRPEARLEGVSAATIVAKALAATPVPSEEIG